MSGIDQYVKLMLHGSGLNDSTTVIDSSIIPRAITVVNAKIKTAQYKFAPSSIYFDGDGDYLTVPDSADWSMGTGNFTIDLWVRFTALPVGVGQSFFGQYVDDNNNWSFRIWPDGSDFKLQFPVYSGGTLTLIPVNYLWSTIAIDTWYHLAISRSGNDWTTFINGEIVATATDADTIGDYASVANIGRHGSGAHYLSGYIDELRVSKGIARWTEAFTPPTEPYSVEVSVDDSLGIQDGFAEEDPTVDANVKLLLHMNGSNNGTTFTDSSPAHKTISRSNAVTKTGEKKFGTASGYFAANSYLSAPDSADWNFGNGDFTIDCWANHSALPSDGSHMMLLSQYVSTTNHWNFRISRGGPRYFFIFEWVASGSYIANVTSSAITIATGQWHHFALTRNGNCFRLFYDGVQVGYSYDTSANLGDFASALYVGSWGSSGGYRHNGYIDEVRVIKGEARWIGDFDVPTMEYYIEGQEDEVLTIDDTQDYEFIEGGRVAEENLGIDDTTEVYQSTTVIDIPEESFSIDDYEDAYNATSRHETADSFSLDDTEILERGEYNEESLVLDDAFAGGYEFDDPYWESFRLNVAWQAININIRYENDESLTIDDTWVAVHGAFGTISKSLPALRGSLYAGGTLSATLPALAGSLSIGLTRFGEIPNAILPILQATITGTIERKGTINLSLPSLRMSATGTAHIVGTISKALPALTITTSAMAGVTGTIALSLPMLNRWTRTTATGVVGVIGALAGTLPPLSIEALQIKQVSDVLCLNTNNLGLTRYEQYPYLGLCSFNGKQLACGSNGIFEFDRNYFRDNSADIDLVVRTGLLYLKKRNIFIKARSAILGYQSNGDLTLTVITEDGKTYDYPVDRLSSDDEGQRVKFGKGLSNRYLALELRNVEGSTMELDKLKVYGEQVTHKRR